MSSHAVEIVDEWNMGWKSRVKRNEKVNMIKKTSLIDSIMDPFNRPWPLIFTWGRSCPIRPYKVVS
jgi:hypothetical protein